MTILDQKHQHGNVQEMSVLNLLYCCEGGGGVFTCVNDEFSASEVPSLDTDAELVWVKITLAKDDPIFICSYYRSPNSMQHSLIQLQESLNKVINNSTHFPSIILAGDFNLQGIVWLDSNGQLGQNPAYSYALNSLFLDIIYDSSLEQFVTDPNRNENILDLVLPPFQSSLKRLLFQECQTMRRYYSLLMLRLMYLRM